MYQEGSVVTITPERIPENAVMCWDADITPVFMGMPGVGKSVQAWLAVKKMAEKMGLGVVSNKDPKKGEFTHQVRHLGNSEAIDLAGIPYTYEDKSGKTLQGRAIMDILPRKGPGVLHCEEIGQNPETQRIMAQIFLDGKINEDWKLPKGMYLMGTGNAHTHRAGSVALYTHLQNRVAQFTVVPTAQGFLAHNREHLTPEVYAAIEWFPEYLVTFDPSKKEPFASPRSWMMVNDLISKAKMVPGDETRPLIYGLIGEMPGANLITMHNCIRELPADIDTMLNDPDGNAEFIQSLSSKPTTLCALAMVLAKRVKTKVDVFPKALKLMEMANEERSCSFVRMSQALNDEVTEHPAYGAFISKHSEYFF